MSDDDLKLSGYSSRPEARGRTPAARKAEPRELELPSEPWERPQGGRTVLHAEYEQDLVVVRRRSRRPGVAGMVLLAAVAVFCIAFVVAPLFAFHSVRSAAQFGDVQALNEAVDFDAVRQSLRVQIRPASVEREPPTSVFLDPLAALRRAWEPVTAQSDVNAYLSADVLAALMNGREATAAVPPPEGLFGGPFPRVRYWGFDRTRLGVADPTSRGRETVFTFRRRGLFEWRLVGVLLPAGATVPTAPPTPSGPETP